MAHRDLTDEYVVTTRLICRSQGATIDEIAKALDKTPRAVYDVLNKLYEMNFPIWDDQDPENLKKKRYHSEQSFAEYLPNTDFTDEDKATFNYLINNAENTPGLMLQAKQLFNKLKIMASEHGQLLELGERKNPAIVSAGFVVKNINNKEAKAVTSELLAAIKGKYWTSLEYKNILTGKTYKMVCFPLVLFTYSGDYYLYVLNTDEQLRMLAVERIKGVISTFEDKIPKTRVNIKELLNDPFGVFCDSEEFKIKLLIDSEQAVYERTRKWPDSVSFEETDGGIIMIAATRCVFECKRWILSRTPHIRILEPEWLQADVVQNLKDALKINTISNI